MLCVAFSDLQNVLQATMPQYSPSISDREKRWEQHRGNPVVQYDLRFHVRDAPRLSLGILTNAAENGDVSLDSVANEIVDRLPWIATGNDNWNVVNILLLWESKMPKHKNVAGVTGDCIQTWISKHNLLIADLTAEGCDIGDMLNDPTGFIRSTLPFMGASEPYVRSFEDYDPADMTIHRDKPYQHATERMKHVLHAQLSAMITSAIESVLFPPVHVGVAATTDRIVVPIVLFRNSENAQHSEQDLLRLVNVDLIKKSLSSVLLPTQEVFVVLATHDIHDHPDVAVAVSAATKHFAKVVRAQHSTDKLEVLQIPFLDSSLLVSELSHAGDQLVQGLLQVGD